ncbi:MAG: serine acetyltransferase [Fusobacteriaceae bacterium]|nr:serine acetyltransferase [Fusobacteriaceae bacterium]
MNKPKPKFNEIISAEIEDWSREKPKKFWDPGQKLLKCIRKYQKWKKRGFIGSLISKLFVMLHMFWSSVCSSEIPLDIKIKGGLKLTHPYGIVINKNSIIGPNCLIFQQVTIGSGSKSGYPKLGGHVDVGAGAKILGGVIIGDHVKIGANAVVIADVPSNSTAIGIPAKIIKHK